MIVSVSVAGCALALLMAVFSGYGLYRAEQSGRCAQPFVLPILVGAAYIVLHGFMVYDAVMVGGPRLVVRNTADIVDTMLILSVLLLLYRQNHRRG